MPGQWTACTRPLAASSSLAVRLASLLSLACLGGIGTTGATLSVLGHLYERLVCQLVHPACRLRGFGPKLCQLTQPVTAAKPKAQKVHHPVQGQEGDDQQDR